MSAYLYEDDGLPEGFKFPQAFLDLMARPEIPYYEPWWFITKFPEEAKGWIEMLRESYPSRVLIPFAKYDCYDDVACFDGTDLSGDPVVHIVHYGASEGWERNGTFRNFDEWLEEALEDMKEWKTSRGPEARIE